MNEEAKTGIYWAVAAVMAALAAFVAWPTTIESEENAQIGKLLFENFTDPLAAASMKIVTFDSDQSALSDFEVAKDADGVWRIPTHGGYAADAEEQMQNAATVFLDNRILDVSTTNREDHAGFGVLDPASSDVKVGAEGVGRLVTFKDGKGSTLVSLIVGNEVEDRAGQRYVRRPGQDIVYAVELDDSALTTKFTDWIEEDLLQMTPFDVVGVTLKNYTASLDMLQGRVSEEREFDAELKTDGSEWQIARLETYKGGTSIARPLAEGEQLDRAKLNELKKALDELKIADVGRKPEGMSANLKASKEFLNDQQAVNSLIARGFIPAGREGSDEAEILAANGEILVGMKDGVKYILRFGNVAGLSEEEQEAAANNEGLGLVGSNRYMLVTTEVDESLIPLPELQTVPQTIEELDAANNPPAEEAPEEKAAVTEEPAEMKPTEDAPAEEAATEEEPAEMKPTEETPAEEAAAEDAPAEDAPAEDAPTEMNPADETPAKEAPVEDAPAEETPAEASLESGETSGEVSGSGSASGAGQQSGDQPPAEETPAEETPAEETPAEETPAEETPAEETPAEESPAEKTPAEETPAEGEKPMPAKETEQEKQERLEAAQEQITKANQRKLDLREEKLEAARKHSAELNARFADWYYEISESTFSKLHLSIDDLITSESEAAASAPPAGFNPAGGMPQFNLPGGPAN